MRNGSRLRRNARRL